MGQTPSPSGKLQDMGMCHKSSAAVGKRMGGCSWISSGKTSWYWGRAANVGCSTSSEAEQETSSPLVAEFAHVT